jgi:phage shock protein PspC (stress-responsive transcriptional regulator)
MNSDRFNREARDLGRYLFVCAVVGVWGGLILAWIFAAWIVHRGF